MADAPSLCARRADSCVFAPWRTALPGVACWEVASSTVARARLPVEPVADGATGATAGTAASFDAWGTVDAGPAGGSDRRAAPRACAADVRGTSVPGDRGCAEAAGSTI